MKWTTPTVFLEQNPPMNFDRNLLVQVQHQFSIFYWQLTFSFFSPLGIFLWNLTGYQRAPVGLGAGRGTEGQDRFITLISLHTTSTHCCFRDFICEMREGERNFSVRRKERATTLKHSLFLRRLKTETEDWRQDWSITVPHAICVINSCK